MSRDEFFRETVRVLQERAGNHCSNPKCRCLTSGPNEALDKSSRIGVAAHITAAAPGGPRYDVSLTTEERRSSENGIWLCQNCARLIDVDPDTYTVQKLIEWRNEAEQWARDQIEGGQGSESVGCQSPEGLSCPYCGTLVLHGRSVCLGCHAEVVYGATSRERTIAMKAGLFCGGMVGVLLMFVLPSWIDSRFELNLALGWGLGFYSILPVGALAVGAGAALVTMQETYRRKNVPRFFRASMVNVNVIVG